MTIEKIMGYLDELSQDIYPQPQDPGHTSWSLDVLETWRLRLSDAHSVMDVGCGEAFLQPWFELVGMEYAGVCRGEDFLKASSMRRTVYDMDFHFLDFPDERFDLVFSRHALEHSPMPLLALMEWHRVAKKFLILVLPNPSYWGWAGRNHYSVMQFEQAKFLLERAGWILVEYFITTEEIRLLCKKVERACPFYEH